MLRIPTRFVVLLSLFASALLCYGVARAQAPTTDVSPIVNDVAPQAFEPVFGAAAASDGSQVRQTQPLQAPKEFSDVMLRWQANEAAGSMVQLEMRVSKDGATWTNWTGVPVDDTDIAASGAPADAVRWSNIYYVENARFYQLRATFRPGSDGTQPALTDMEAHTLYVQDQPEAQTTEAETAATGAAPRPAYVSRTQWGSPDGENAPKAPPKFFTASHIIVHHTAEPNSLGSHPNWASRVRAIWSYHAITRGWGDIGYNWLIDPTGKVYAGRAGSTRLDADAAGFHDSSNRGSMGVSILGTYTSVQPPAAAQSSLVNLMAWKAQQRGIDPLGRSYYYGCSRSSLCYPFNEGAILRNISGHRQVAPGHTTCPGDAFMSIMGTLRQRVVDKIAATKARTDNGDLVIDNTESTFTWAGDMKDSTCGLNGNSYWTWASSANDGIVNDVAGVWRPNIPKTGKYNVSVLVSAYCTSTYTTNARYEVAHAGGKANVPINQQTQRGWVSLGTFDFNAGNSAYVRLSDLSNDAYSSKRAVMFDAVKWEPVTQPVATPTPSATPTPTPKPSATPTPTPKPSATPTPTPPPSSAATPVLVGAKVRTPSVAAGEVAAVEFTVKNPGTVPIETQLPDGGTPSDPESGWAYDEGECFAGGDNVPAYGATQGRLRAVLGFAPGSPTTAVKCPVDAGGWPWRWGFSTPLQPGETRTMIGYVRFRTPGTYQLNANLVSEGVKQLGTDGKGASVPLSVTVNPETIAPATVLMDAAYKSNAAVYGLKPTPTSLLSRSANPMSVVEGNYVGTFAWDGSAQNWGSGGPLGQTDRFIVRQTRGFYAPTAGTYRFRITSDAGSWLWVDGKQVISNHGLHTTRSAEASVNLSAGYHTLGVKLFEHTGSAYAGYSWQPPGATSFTTMPTANVINVSSGGRVVLTADDLGGSGVAALRYRIGNGAEQQSSSGLAQVDLPAGTHTIMYQAEDRTGNKGSWKTITVTVPTR